LPGLCKNVAEAHLIVSFITGNGHLQMHGEAAVALLRLMGHTGTVPGAILATDLGTALASLRKGLETSGDAVVPAPPPRPTPSRALHAPRRSSVRRVPSPASCPTPGWLFRSPAAALRSNNACFGRLGQLSHYFQVAGALAISLPYG